jgi:hypothetical protein
MGRTTALSREWSTRGAGDHGTKPGGVRICLRPARWRTPAIFEAGESTRYPHSPGRGFDPW